MIVRHLGHTDFNVIMECFLTSIENYYVKMPTDYEFYKQRWKAAKVDLNFSYGMFENTNLVGFIIHAVDERFGDKIAFNTGTGVIPKYRGKRIVKSIYDYALPRLKQQGINKSVLEVITENHKAIKAYESVGFKICKTLKCYSGKVSVDTSSVSLNEVGFNAIDWLNLPNQDLYSWDNYFECLKHGPYRYFQVLKAEKVVSYFVINSENGYVAQFEVLHPYSNSWAELFNAIGTINNSLKINNIDERLIEKIKAVESVGLKNSVNQYEMELRLSS